MARKRQEPETDARGRAPAGAKLLRFDAIALSDLGLFGLTDTGDVYKANLSQGGVVTSWAPVSMKREAQKDE